ncbi:MAG: threonine dehydratase [Nostoc sp. SerVER01]|uniref:threonine dehydratase n=1 Tax=Nostoc sp. CCY 9925 TaxID=3103865 RepID=UPI002ADB450A|nr:threonine dehydratase [Nostoc sp. SerVER01]MDZ8029075.1 threonine dehydratase [Nostoc sp. DedQUE11]MDZ8075089.1 threonine dehydratase [Nostoc sp. DedQUE01]MDZ8237151.1 threonine dehydratase [Nostoc sp. ChiQUE01a]
MLPVTQIIRNFFLRLEGFLSVVFKPLLNFVRNLFGFFTRVFGFTSSNYFLESDGAQDINKEPIPTAENTTPETPATTRRRPNTKKIDDYYINMVRDVKNN